MPVQNNVLNFNMKQQNNLNLKNIPLKPNTAHIQGRYRSPRTPDQYKPILKNKQKKQYNQSPDPIITENIQKYTIKYQKSIENLDKQIQDINNKFYKKVSENSSSFLMKKDSLENRINQNNKNNNNIQNNQNQNTYKYNQGSKQCCSDRQHYKKKKSSSIKSKQKSLEKKTNLNTTYSSKEDSTKEETNLNKNIIFKYAQTEENFNIQNQNYQQLKTEEIQQQQPKIDKINTYDLLRKQEFKKLELEYQLQLQKRPKTTPTNQNKNRYNTGQDQQLYNKLSSTFYMNGPQNLSRYEFGPVIGQGSYAVVRFAKDKLTNKRVAIKIYDKYKLLDPQKRNNVKREIYNLQKLNHPNIIKLYMTVDTKTTVNLVMEYIGNTSLRQYLKNQPQRKIPENKTKNLFKQLIQSLKFCHDNSIAHRDIKLENILIQDEKVIKLIDFGFSVKTSEENKLNVFCGTPSYMSPEIILKREYVGQYADIWSCGVLLYVILLGRFPFKGKDDNELYKKIIKCDYVIQKEDNLSQEVQDLLSKLLVYRPQDRLNINKVLGHAWFSTF